MAFSVYVHVPFCRSRCSYCAFYSGEPLDRLAAYANRVTAEVGIRERLQRARLFGPVSTVYFGGGTPSLLAPSDVGKILEAIHKAWGIEKGAEVTLEANPAADADLAGFRVAGVNRLSVGVQCTDDRVLRTLGRRHTTELAFRTLREATRAGFSALGADLLYGLPGLTPQDLKASAQALKDAGVRHVSAYSLEIHPGTPFHAAQLAGTFAPADPEEEEAQWAALDGALDSLGYRMYEVSNYSLEGYRCRHNVAYWEGVPYVGLGPGAHGFDPTSGPWGSRFWAAPDLPAHEASVSAGRLPPGGREELSASDSLLEALFLALRRTDFFDVGRLCLKHGFPEGSLQPRLDQAVAARLLEAGPALGLWRPTRQGLRTADGLALWLYRALTGSAGR